MPLNQQVSAALVSALESQDVPRELSERLRASVSEIIDHYVAGRLRPAELHGGDFVEAGARILQFLAEGSYARIGRPLPRFDHLLAQMEASSLDDTLRIHVPRALQMIYDIRNRRGVGHLPGEVSANRSDAELILQVAKWVLAEFIRLFHTNRVTEAQQIVDALVRRQLTAVQDFEGTLRVVSRRSVSLPNQILTLLLAAEPSEPTLDQIVAWTRGARNVVRTALSRLDRRRVIHRFPDGRIRLTALGQEEAESVLRLLQ